MKGATLMKTEKAIQRFLEYIEKAPYIFYSEGDLVCLLHKELCIEYPNSYPMKKWGRAGLVHAEYPQEGRRIIDLVVLRENEVREIDQKWLSIGDKQKKKGYRWVELQNAIEIKFEGKENALKKDIEKLKSVRKNSKEPPELHLIYVFRRPKPTSKLSRKINDCIEKIRKECEKENIRFYFKKLTKFTENK